MINPHTLTQSLAGGSERSIPQCTLVTIKKHEENYLFCLALLLTFTVIHNDYWLDQT